jgi:hypothetical protein
MLQDLESMANEMPQEELHQVECVCDLQAASFVLLNSRSHDAAQQIQGNVRRLLFATFRVLLLCYHLLFTSISSTLCIWIVQCILTSQLEVGDTAPAQMRQLASIDTKSPRNDDLPLDDCCEKSHDARDH